MDQETKTAIKKLSQNNSARWEVIESRINAIHERLETIVATQPIPKPHHEMREEALQRMEERTQPQERPPVESLPEVPTTGTGFVGKVLPKRVGGWDPDEPRVEVQTPTGEPFAVKTEEYIAIAFFTKLQREIGAWSFSNFGEGESKAKPGLILGSISPLWGIVEEVGDLCGVTIKHHQHRRGYDDVDKYKADRNDAVADTLVFLCDYCEREDINMIEVLLHTWHKVVKKRNAATREGWDSHVHDKQTTLGVDLASGPDKSVTAVGVAMTDPVVGKVVKLVDDNFQPENKLEEHIKTLRDAIVAGQMVEVKPTDQPAADNVANTAQPAMKAFGNLGENNDGPQYITEKPMCPHCSGHVNDEVVKRYKNGLIEQMFCSDCGKTFKFLKGEDNASE